MEPFHGTRKGPKLWMRGFLSVEMALSKQKKRPKAMDARVFIGRIGPLQTKEMAKSVLSQKV